MSVITTADKLEDKSHRPLCPPTHRQHGVACPLAVLSPPHTPRRTPRPIFCRPEGYSARPAGCGVPPILFAVRVTAGASPSVTPHDILRRPLPRQGFACDKGGPTPGEGSVIQQSCQQPGNSRPISHLPASFSIDQRYALRCRSHSSLPPSAVGEKSGKRKE